MNHPEVIVIPVIFLTIYMVIKTLSDNRIKRILIEKGETGESLKHLNMSQPLNGLNSMKWGLILIGIGAAFFIAELFPREISDGGLLGLMSLFAGVGFLVYYNLAKKELSQKDGE